VGYTLVSAPGAEPITRQTAKLHLRLITDLADVTAHPDDTLVDMLVAAARQWAEHETQRSLITQTWKLTRHTFADLAGVITLAKGPVQAVEEITYRDMAGVVQTLAPTEYVVDLTGKLGLVAPAFGKAWPPTLPQIGAVAITYRCGYGDSGTDVPEAIRNWMLLRIRALYDNPSEVGREMRPLPFADRMLDPHRILVA
jgi:uncharacterized phiE125 gp8 family phage protein